MLDQKYKEKIRQVYLTKVRRGDPEIQVSQSWLEPDGRKSAKALKDAVEEGYGVYGVADRAGLTPLVLTSKIWDEIEAVPFVSTNVWGARYNPDNPATELPYLRTESSPAGTGDLTTGQWKWLFEHRDAFHWAFLDPSAPTGYRFDPATSLIGGDGSLEEAVAGIEAVAGTRRVYDHVLVITSPDLKAHVAEVLLARKVAELYPRNMEWALAASGALTADEARAFKKVLPNPAAFPGSGKETTDAAQWPGQVRASLDKKLQRLRELGEEISVLVDVERKVVEFGGWARVINEGFAEFEAAFRAKAKAEAEKEAELREKGAATEEGSSVTPPVIAVSSAT